MATNMKTTTKPSVTLAWYEFAPSERIDRFVTKQLAADNLSLLGFLYRDDNRYLMTGDFIIDVPTSKYLRTAPTLQQLNGHDSKSAHVIWGQRAHVNGSKALDMYQGWCDAEDTTYLRYTGRTRKLDDRKVVVFESEIRSEANEPQYIIVQRRYLRLMVRELVDLQGCIVELLETNAVRVRVGSRVLGVVMPMAKGGRIFFSDEELRDPLDDDAAQETN